MKMSFMPAVMWLMFERSFRINLDSLGVLDKNTVMKRAKRYQNNLKRDAMKSQYAENPYTWRYKFTAGETLDSYDAVFDKCGICELFKRLDVLEITPALCAYDYEMAKHTGTIFTREFTLASGGPVCDCHYQRKRE